MVPWVGDLGSQPHYFVLGVHREVDEEVWKERYKTPFQVSYIVETDKVS